MPSARGAASATESASGVVAQSARRQEAHQPRVPILEADAQSLSNPEKPILAMILGQA